MKEGETVAGEAVYCETCEGGVPRTKSLLETGDGDSAKQAAVRKRPERIVSGTGGEARRPIPYERMH